MYKYPCTISYWRCAYHSCSDNSCVKQEFDLHVLNFFGTARCEKLSKSNQNERIVGQTPK